MVNPQALDETTIPCMDADHFLQDIYIYIVVANLIHRNMSTVHWVIWLSVSAYPCEVLFQIGVACLPFLQSLTGTVGLH